MHAFHFTGKQRQQHNVLLSLLLIYQTDRNRKKKTFFQDG